MLISSLFVSPAFLILNEQKHDVTITAALYLQNGAVTSSAQLRCRFIFDVTIMNIVVHCPFHVVKFEQGFLTRLIKRGNYLVRLLCFNIDIDILYV